VVKRGDVRSRRTIQIGERRDEIDEGDIQPAKHAAAQPDDLVIRDVECQALVTRDVGRVEMSNATKSAALVDDDGAVRVIRIPHRLREREVKRFERCVDVAVRREDVLGERHMCRVRGAGVNASQLVTAGGVGATRGGYAVQRDVQPVGPDRYRLCRKRKQ